MYDEFTHILKLLSRHTRSALGDVTGAIVNVPLNEVGVDAKRLKTGESVQQTTGQNSAPVAKQR